MPKKVKRKVRYEAQVVLRGEAAGVVGRLLYEELGILGIQVAMLSRESASDEVGLSELVAELRKGGCFVSITVEDE